MWRAFQDRWNGQSRLLTLVDEGRAAASVGSTLRMRLHFGARLAKAQLLSECDWVFYTHLSVARVQGFLPTRLRRPYGVFLHGIEVWGSLSNAQRAVLENARVLVSNSLYTAERANVAHPWMPAIQPCSLALVPETNDVDRIEPVSSLGPHVVLLVGRISAAERYKGHDQLLDAWPQLLRSVPDAKLVFAGSGDDEARLRQRARDLGVTESVVFMGFVEPESLAGVYRGAALLAMPSRNEGFGLVYLEAMSYGLPCIGSRQDAAGEVIEDGKTGFLVNQGSTTQLADALTRLLTDQALRRRLGAGGQRRARERFSYAGFRDRFTALLADAFETGHAHS
jgi:phosphatidylinositol alpha-1,6-mannosyltransferase